MPQKKKLIIIAVAVIVIVVAGATIFKKGFKASPKAFYEVAVMVRSQVSSDPVEDAKSSLKAGDVIVIQNEGHNWSASEKISYLILKMELTEEQKEKLMAPKVRIRDKSELSEEERKMVEEEEKQMEESKERDKNFVPERLRETLILREYQIDFSKLPEFSADGLMNGQPFLEEVYGWSIVKRK